jgi:hypothetical protein
MGLTSWRGNDVRRTDVEIAKNYLSEEELIVLNGLTEQYPVSDFDEFVDESSKIEFNRERKQCD